MKKLLVAVAAVGLFVAADKAKDDAAKLAGEWEVVSGKVDGKDEDLDGAKVIFKDNKMTFKGKNDEHEAAFKLDSTKKPKQADFVPSDGDQAGQTLKGIYSLEKDELKLCIGLDPSQERPTDFTSEDGSKRILVVLKRQK